MATHRTVLVVDDDHGARESLERLISRAGIACLSARNGPEALTLLREHQISAVVSDHDMPGMDGVELLKLVATRYPHVARILLTGRRDAEPAVRAVNVAQAWRFLAKPCRAGDLLTALHFAFEASDHELEVRRLSSELRRAQALLAEVRLRCPELMEEIDSRRPAA